MQTPHPKTRNQKQEKNLQANHACDSAQKNFLRQVKLYSAKRINREAQPQTNPKQAKLASSEFCARTSPLQRTPEQAQRQNSPPGFLLFYLIFPYLLAMWKKSVLIAAILVGFLIHQLVPHSHDLLTSQKTSVSAEKIPSTFDLLKKAVADGEHGCQLHDVQLSSCDCSVDVYFFVDSIISAQEVSILSNPITTVAFFLEKPPLYSGSILAHSRRGPPTLA